MNLFIISVDDTVSALRKVNTNKATGPDNIPAWVLKEHAHCLAAPLASILIVKVKGKTILLATRKSWIYSNYSQ